MSLSWDVSLSEVTDAVAWYKIYRSRSSVLTDPVALTEFSDIDSLNSWDENYTILIDSVAAGTMEHTDDSIPMNGQEYYYWLQAVGLIGESEKVAARAAEPVLIEDLPGQIRVDNPYPNPFNPATTIRYHLPVSCHVQLVIYDIYGRKVALLENSYHNAGTHEIIWNGKNDNGYLVASGVYIFRLTTDSFTAQ